MNKNISISLFRVSADSKFLDIIFACPYEYHFTYLEIEVRTLGADGKFASQWFDLSDALFGEEESQEKKLWAVRIPLDKLGIAEPAIYIANIKAYYPGNELEEIPSDTLEDSMICSDVNDVYYLILDSLFMLEDKCLNVPDDAIIKYLILYGHQEALRHNTLEAAEMYYKLIINKFNKCGHGYRPKNKIVKSSCNCNKR